MNNNIYYNAFIEAFNSDNDILDIIQEETKANIIIDLVQTLNNNNGFEYNNLLRLSSVNKNKIIRDLVDLLQ